MPAPEPRCPGGGDHVLSAVDETPDGEVLECVVDGCGFAVVVGNDGTRCLVEPVEAHR